jgi:hypothetical protein
VNKLHKVLLSAIVIFLVLVAAEMAWLLEASINYGFNYDYVYQKEGSNWFTVDEINNNRTSGMFLSVECYNVGFMDGTFSIVIEFANAAFSAETPQPFLQLNNSTVKVPLMLHGGGHQSTDVYFTVDNSVTSFNLKVSFESNQVLMRSTESNFMGINTMRYIWSESQNSFSPILIS